MPWAVIDDPQRAPTAGLELDGDAASAGVERVVDQLLDDRRWPLDHLPGRDLIDDGVGQPLDPRRARLPSVARPPGDAHARSAVLLGLPP
jgi:hypothetical protein